MWWNSSTAIQNPKEWCDQGVAFNMSANLENSPVAIGLEKVTFHSNPKERQCQRMFKLLYSCTHWNECYYILLRLSSKSFKLGFNSTWTENFHMFKLDLEKAEEPEIKLPAFTGSYKRQGNSRKTFSSASLATQKPLTLWITVNCGKFKEMGILDHPACLLCFSSMDQSLPIISRI